MATQGKAGYFYIGLFVLVGVFLLVLAIVILGSKLTTKDVVYAETYFNESVQGLSVGSPVKYLGMDIGRVVDIMAIDSVYSAKPQQEKAKIQDFRKYVYVKMAVSTRFFKGYSEKEIGDRIRLRIKTGLRVQLATQGLTGNAYLALTYVDPKTAVSLPIGWEPENSYIPSIPSTLAYFSDNAQQIVGELRKIEWQKMFDSVQKLVVTTKETAGTANKLLLSTNSKIMETMDNLQEVSQNVKAITEQAKIYPSSILLGKPPQQLDLNKL
jgi:ABC-type transporter Mla subunit MlaD